jgi:hypothetical protein
MMMLLLLFCVTAIALDWLHVKVSAARGLQDRCTKSPAIVISIAMKRLGQNDQMEMSLGTYS